MPQVPYQPVPDVQPQNIPSPLLQVRTDPNMFGANVGRAIEGLGTTMDKVGDELFSRAMAMQQLRNETEKTNAMSQFEQQIGDKHNAFTQLRGVNAVNGYDAYRDDIVQTRKNIRDGLSNDMARKMFDAESLSFQWRTLFSGGAHAGNEGARSVIDSEKARQEIWKNTALANPQSSEEIRDYLARNAESERKQGDVQGLTPDQINRNIFDSQSSYLRHAIDGWARHDPGMARKLYLENKSSLIDKDALYLDRLIQDQTRTVHSRESARSIHEGWPGYVTPSQRNLMRGVQGPMIQILQKAMNDNPDLRILPTSGLRTEKEQADLYAKFQRGEIGLAAKPGTSRHEAGLAVDLQPGPGTTDAQIESAMKKASADLGIPLSSEHDAIKARDSGHYSLPRDYDVTTAPKRQKEPEQVLLQRAEDYGRSAYPDDPLMPDAIRQRVGGLAGEERRITAEAKIENNNTLSGLMINRGDGNSAKNLEEILATPAGRSAYDNLPETEQRTWPAKINAYNKSIEVQTDPRYKTYLRGLEADDPKEFLKETEDPTSLPLSQRDMQNLYDRRRRVRKTMEQDFNVTSAFNIINEGGKLFNNPNVPMRKGGTQEEKDNYYAFKGALAQELELLSQRNGGKPATRKEIVEIGRHLLYDEAQRSWWSKNAPWWLLGGGEPTPQPIFTIGNRLTSEEREQIRRDLMKQSPGIVIEDNDINIEAARQALDLLRQGAGEK